MMLRSVPYVAATLAVMAPPASSASPFRPVPSPEGERDVKRADGLKPVSGLPYAKGREFANLDEYLAFRRARGAIDLPWYKEVAPGIFELQTNMRPAPPAKRLTRAELARQFGFDR